MQILLTHCPIYIALLQLKRDTELAKKLALSKVHQFPSFQRKNLFFFAREVPSPSYILHLQPPHCLDAYTNRRSCIVRWVSFHP